LKFTALSIISSTLEAGTSDNDTNVLPNLEVVVNPYLTSRTAWFIRDNTIDNVLFLEREKPAFEAVQNGHDSLDIRCRAWARFASGVVDWRGIVGSPGT